MIVGTRPEAIKLASVAAALAVRDLSPRLLFTGQHPGLDPADYGLDGYTAERLDCPGQQDPHAHAGMVSKAVAPLLAAIGPAMVLVQGDTSSALGGALAARLAGTPLGHVEAGLRSHNRSHPWPEEEFRIAIDRESDLLFAPTQVSAANLRRERIGGEIHVTGNSGIDALLELAQGPRLAKRGLPRLLATCHRRENWDSRLDDVCTALAAIASARIATVEVLLHPNAKVADRVRCALDGHGGVTLQPACAHGEAVKAMLACDLVLSDSGGMQEEASALGVPLLVLRERTERPEAIADGSIELVGTDPRRIVGAVRRRLAAAPAAPAASEPFGDGRAGERIAAIVEDWLDRHGGLSPFAGAPDGQGLASENWCRSW